MLDVYGTVEQLKMRIQISSTPSASQVTLMEEILEAASRAIDRFCKREEGFGNCGIASAKYFTSEGESFLRTPKFLSVSEVAVKTSKSVVDFTSWTKETTYLAGDGDWYAAHGDPKFPDFKSPYDLILISPLGDYSVFPVGDGAPVIKVTAVWGSQDTVPADIREACLMQAARWLKQFQGSMSSELGTVDLGVIQYRRRLSSDICQILIEGCWVLPLYGGA